MSSSRVGGSVRNRGFRKRRRYAPSSELPAQASKFVCLLRRVPILRQAAEARTAWSPTAVGVRALRD